MVHLHIYPPTLCSYIWLDIDWFADWRGLEYEKFLIATDLERYEYVQ